jgi:membrane protein DedA with SNARE-associated domain
VSDTENQTELRDHELSVATLSLGMGDAQTTTIGPTLSGTLRGPVVTSTGPITGTFQATSESDGWSFSAGLLLVMVVLAFLVAWIWWRFVRIRRT